MSPYSWFSEHPFAIANSLHAHTPWTLMRTSNTKSQVLSHLPSTGSYHPVNNGMLKLRRHWAWNELRSRLISVQLCHARFGSTFKKKKKTHCADIFGDDFIPNDTVIGVDEVDFLNFCFYFVGFSKTWFLQPPWKTTTPSSRPIFRSCFVPRM